MSNDNIDEMRDEAALKEIAAKGDAAHRRLNELVSLRRQRPEYLARIGHAFKRGGYAHALVTHLDEDGRLRALELNIMSQTHVDIDRDAQIYLDDAYDESSVWKEMPVEEFLAVWREAVGGIPVDPLALVQKP